MSRIAEEAREWLAGKSGTRGPTVIIKALLTEQAELREQNRLWLEGLQEQSALRHQAEQRLAHYEDSLHPEERQVAEHIADFTPSVEAEAPERLDPDQDVVAMVREMRDPATRRCTCGYPEKPCLRIVLRNGPPFPERPCEPEAPAKLASDGP